MSLAHHTIALTLATSELYSRTIAHKSDLSKINDFKITVAFFFSPPHSLYLYIMENMRYYST